MLGSNVFNILLGLGLPWMIASAMSGAPYHTGETSIIEPALILMGYLLALLLLLAAFGWRLPPAMGWLLLCMQALYWTWNVGEEYGLLSAPKLLALIEAPFS